MALTRSSSTAFTQFRQSQLTHIDKNISKLPMNDHFYRAFEERYYAPRSTIKALRQQYLPFVTPLALAYPEGNTFDIGCGRGEWLELMKESGLKPYGVDLDPGMLQGCIDLGLPAQQGDAVVYLKTLRNESQIIISAFHVVEHISFEQLQSVVTESLRALKPGGLLIMETPNAENVGVGTCNFYLDPTHQRPVPDLLLSFLVEYAGFARTKVLKLQENKALASSSSISLIEVLTGVSPDYAVIGQKDGPDSILESLNAVFETSYGLSLSALSKAYDEQREMRIQQAMAMAEQARDTANRINSEIRETIQLLCSSNQNLQAQLQNVYNSYSWGLTAPLRKLSSILRRLTTRRHNNDKHDT